MRLGDKSEIFTVVGVMPTEFYNNKFGKNNQGELTYTLYFPVGYGVLTVEMFNKLFGEEFQYIYDKLKEIHALNQTPQHYGWFPDYSMPPSNDNVLTDEAKELVEKINKYIDYEDFDIKVLGSDIADRAYMNKTVIEPDDITVMVLLKKEVRVANKTSDSFMNYITTGEFL